MSFDLTDIPIVQPEKVAKLSKSAITLDIYLYFNGNAAEAIEFYKDIFDAKLQSKMTFADGPPPHNDDIKDKIMHAVLSFDNATIMLADGGLDPKESLKVGNNARVSISLDDVVKGGIIFQRLAEGGNTLMEYKPQFWGATYGQCIDKFGVSWMVNVNNQK